MRLPLRTGRLLPSAGEQLLRTQTIAFLYKNHQFINKNMIPFWTGRLLSSMFAFYHHFFIGLQQKLIKSSLISIFSTVHFQMCPQIACLRRRKVTLVAFVRLFSTVCFQMSSQIKCLGTCKVTLAAFVRLFSTVHFQMCFQMTCLRRGIVTLVAFI